VRLLLGLTGCNVVGRECLVCCVKLVKCVLGQLTVMMHIAIGKMLRKYDRKLQAKIVCRKIVMLSANSTL